MLETKQKQIRRHKRVRAKIIGTKERPRLCVFSSNSHILAQIINDAKGVTLTMADDKGLKIKKSETKEGPITGKKATAFEVGKLIAQKAAEKKIESVVFDRGGFKYHGVIKALAQGAREGGLKF
jgi:large subunit ribosomal protein L18